MTAWMSSYAFRHAMCSIFSVVGLRVPSTTVPSRSQTTRSSSVIVSYSSDDGVSATFPSGSRAEKLPAVPFSALMRLRPPVLSHGPLVESGSGPPCCAWLPLDQYFRVDAVHRLLA